MPYKVLISDPLSEEGIKPLRDQSDIQVTIETKLTKDQLIEIIPNYDALLVRSQTQVTREILEHASRLKVVGRAGVGVDNIDLEAATELGVLVVNAPDGNTISAAEHTMAMLLAVARNVPQAYASLKANKWDRKAFVGVELNGKTLGVVGLGRIGTEVTKRAKGFKMKVKAYDPYLTEEKANKLGIEYGTLAEVLSEADFITVHTPLLKQTKHLIDESAFKQMKPDARVINCARGGIIDEDALYDAVVSKQIAGAALDVFEDEPIKDNKLLSLPEVIATPHLGASTIEAQKNVAIDVSKEVADILLGGLARHPVNIPAIPSDVYHEIAPYFDLTEKLGVFMSNLADGAIEEVTIHYSGELTKVNVSPLSRNIVKGLLKRYLGTHVNDVNAIHLAGQKGIAVNEQKTTNTFGFTNLITVETKTAKGARQVSGTYLQGFGAHIVKVDDYRIDVVPEENLVLIHHKDQPGVIGRVGSLLADYNINIATMKVGRSEVGGDAVMMLTIDSPLQEEWLENIREISGISHIKSIKL